MRISVLKALHAGNMMLLSEVASAAGMSANCTREMLTSLHGSGEAGCRNGYWWAIPPAADRRDVQRVEVDGVS